MANKYIKIYHFGLVKSRCNVKHILPGVAFPGDAQYVNKIII